MIELTKTRKDTIADLLKFKKKDSSHRNSILESMNTQGEPILESAGNETEEGDSSPISLRKRLTMELKKDLPLSQICQPL